jgi:hypothetical protein
MPRAKQGPMLHAPQVPQDRRGRRAQKPYPAEYRAQMVELVRTGPSVSSISQQCARIPTPNIAHVMPDRGEFPRHLDAGLDGYFVVVASTSLRHVCWIDPYMGQLDDQPTEFLALASGVFLLFHEAAAPAPTQHEGHRRCFAHAIVPKSALRDAGPPACA